MTIDSPSLSRFYTYRLQYIVGAMTQTLKYIDVYWYMYTKSLFGGTVGVTPPPVTACCFYSLLFTL